MKFITLKATTMRLLLAIIIVSSIVLVSFIFYQTQEHFKDIAYAVKSSGSTNSGKANLVTSNPQKLQSQLKQSLSTYAAASGITLKSIDVLPAQSFDANIQTKTSLQSKSFDIVVQNPVPYINFLKFTKAIESNLPIIMISSIKLSRLSTPVSNINVDSLVISVAVK